MTYSARLNSVYHLTLNRPCYKKTLVRLYTVLCIQHGHSQSVTTTADHFTKIIHQAAKSVICFIDLFTAIGSTPLYNLDVSLI